MSKRLPPLSSLATFESVARTGTVSAAAEELSVTSSAISQRLKQLENFYNFPLFERVNGRLILTEKGQVLADVCSMSFERIASVSDSLTETKDNNEINISCLPSFAYMRLMSTLSEFEALGNFQINLNTSNALVDFKNSTCDLAIRYTNKIDDPRLDYCLIANEVVFPCVSPSIIEQLNTTNLKTLAQHYPLIMDSGLGLDIKPNWPQWIEAYENFDFDSCKTVLFSDYQFSVKCAIDAKGILLARNVIVEEEIKKGSLIRINMNELNSHASYYLVSHKDRTLKKPVKLFYQWFCKNFSQ